MRKSVCQVVSGAADCIDNFVLLRPVFLLANDFLKLAYYLHFRISGNDHCEAGAPLGVATGGCSPGRRGLCF